MLQNLRENLKGAVAVVFIGFIVLVMVVSGDGMMQSSGSEDVASVNGDDISSKDLQRAMMQEKIRLKNQFQLDDSSEQLKDENLRGPALEALIRERALVHAAQNAGMGVSDTVVKDLIKQGFTQNNQFNTQAFNGYLNQYGLTQASLIERESEGYLVRQLLTGLADSSFVTSKDIALLASIAGQKRSFSTLTIPKEKLGKIAVTDEEINKYYSDNQATFTEEEKVALQYVQISIDDLARVQTPTEDEIKAAFTKEQETFAAKPEYAIAHILLEKKADADKEAHAAKVADVQAKLAKGEAFEALAKSASDDLGSKELGGDLGLLTDALPENFKAAVYALNEGQVSPPVTTDAGTHFIKLKKKTVPVAPTFEERKVAIAAQLAKDTAAQKYVDHLKALDELTFGKDNLESAAKTLGLEVKTTTLFGRSGGVDIAAARPVIDAAFAKDVLEQGQNSKVLEITNDKAVVVRLKDHVASHVKPLEQVKPAIVSALTQNKATAQLQELAKQVTEKLSAGAKPEDVAKELGYTFASFDNVDRFKAASDRETLQQAFAMVRPAPGKPQIETFTNAAGDQVVVSLNSVVNGEAKDMEPQQLAAMKAQVERQLSSDETTAYEISQYSSAKVRR